MRNQTLEKYGAYDRFRKEFFWEPLRDPIHNYIEYDEILEKKIIDTYIFQRLRRLHQLQSARFVYPGATHTRFEHSLGTMFIASIFAENLFFCSKDIPFKEEEFDFLLESTRLAALLHDIGHGPYSHAFDDAIIMNTENPQHEDLKNKGIRHHEDLGRLLIIQSEIGDLLGNFDFFKKILNYQHYQQNKHLMISKILR
ncbi:MAG: HD domain-containing protein [Candidatus Thermoplasmatota archaeon]